MPNVTARSILDSVRNSLNDIKKTGWTDEELLSWLNAGVIAVIQLRPDALVKREKFLCSKSSRQELPAGAIRLVRVEANLGGGSIRYMDREKLDSTIPDWQDESQGSSDVELYVFDAREPRAFYLYPCPVAGHPIRLIYSYSPSPIDISDLTTAKIPIEDTFRDPIFDYIMFRALSKETDHADGAARAANHMNAFNLFLTGKTQSDSGIKPNGRN